MAFVARPRSKAAGAYSWAGGSVDESVKLHSKPYNFTRDESDHGGQWARPIQQTWQYYNILLETFSDDD